MARLLVELKLRLVANALRSSTAARVSFVLSTTFAVLVAIGIFWLLAQLRPLSASVDLTTVIFSIFAIGWLIGPILAFGLDGTLDPATMALYPLRTRPLVIGLLAASAAGAWPVANVLGLLGVTIGLAHGALGVLVSLLAVVLQVLFCIVLARFVITSMARLLRSRRGKDLAVFLFVPVFAIFEFLIQVIPRAVSSGSLSPSSFAGVDSWLRWLPPGLAAHAIQDASTGHLVDAMARLGLVVAVIIVLGVLWVRSLQRALVTTDTTTGSSRVHNTALPLARFGLRGAVAARFWRYQSRDPASLAYWAIVVVIMFVCSASTIVGPHKHPAVVVASAVFGAAFAGVTPCQSCRLDRAGVRDRSHGAERAPPAAFLFRRPGHRVRRDRDTAGRRDLLRPRGAGQGSQGRLRRRRGWPGRARRSAGDEQHLQCRAGVSHAEASR